MRVAFLLYLLTAIMTALPVLFMLRWAIWGAPTSVWQYVSLLGSCLLVLAGFVSVSHRRVAARIAVFGVAAIWCFYLPGVTSVVHARLTDQRLTVQVVRWKKSQQVLTVSDVLQATNAALTTADLEQFRKLKLNGTIENAGRLVSGTAGAESHALIVLDHPVLSRAELPEPDAVTVVYIQRQDGWQKYPATAPTLKRTISLQSIQTPGRAPMQTEVMVEWATGERRGFGVLWPESEAPR
jgi:hypothetical protein